MIKITTATDIYTRLDAQDISYQTYTHPALYTVAESQATDIQIPTTHTKNLFIKSKKGSFYLITMLATKKLNSKRFRQNSNIGEFSFASADDLYIQLGLMPGSVGIFGLYNNPNITLYIDTDIYYSPSAGRHPNDNTATIAISHEDLLRYLYILDIQYNLIDI